MFRKTWKQIKILLILLIVIFFFPRSFLPRPAFSHQADELDMYIKQNESELRLAGYKDDENALRLKLAQLEVINRSRRKHNASPLKLDILASRVANKMCREAAINKYTGHRDLAGETPYMRYAFAGGYDHVMENAYGEWSSDNYPADNNNISSMMEEGHQSFMDEKAPYDGHKKNIINKSHNYVGIGYYLTGNQFRYYEEFIDRYFTFANIPDEVNPGDTAKITLETDGTMYPYFLIVYYEKFPKPLKPGRITAMGSYNDYTRDVYRTIPPWELTGYKKGISYTIPLIFKKEGLYYIQTYIDRKEYTRPAGFSTEGKTPYTGIVIKAPSGNK
ncbi:MAG TPA: CAP domain-containing protein [Bacteroidales bacterium]|nr:CAP domain-containing protein [Bacteroidales bacterium]